MTIRIELQDKERELLSGFIAGNQVSDVAGAIDQLLSFENLYIGATIAELITGQEILPGTPNDIYQLIDWVREWMKGSQGWGEGGFAPDPGALKPGGEYAGLEGFFRFVWERATVLGWVLR